ncbi:MAG: chorismate synthase [Candidatus Cloacimonadota bacterium]|nr:MAG: chorismate synthase [Candidatus Cloacimonadota bacterium]PIE81100.1 MAG: chorismate synthase [Candidatus Delongbacteria bacterium]
MNSFGKIFRVTIYGESHSKQVGIVVDGVPCGIELSIDDFRKDLERRRSGKLGSTTRLEADLPNIINGYFEGYTTGAPLHIYFENRNIRSKDYKNLLSSPRPGHADFTAKVKFNNFNDYRGGGYFSGRLTLGVVSAGVVAKKILKGVTIKAKLIELGGEEYSNNILKKAISEKDSLGGVIECSVDNLPIGLGEPFFNSVESLISHIIFSIPGVRGIEFGSGFNSARQKGSEHNDSIIDSNGKTLTNNCGGVNGGITNGNQLIFRVAVKPTSSIGKVQNTYNFDTDSVQSLEIEGRHDTAFVLRVPVVVEAVTAIVLADLKFINSVSSN